MKIIWETKKARLVYYPQYGYILQFWSKYNRIWRANGSYNQSPEQFKQEDYQ